MSNVDKRSYIGPNDPLYYAPRGLREREAAAAALEVPGPANDWPERRSGETFLKRTAGRDLAQHELPPRDRLDGFANAVVTQTHHNAPVLYEHEEPASWFSGATRWILLAVSLAAVAALIVVFALPVLRAPDTSSAETTPPRKALPTLLVQEGSGIGSEAVPLGVTVNAAGTGASVVVTRLPSGARLTVGKRLSATEWRVPLADLARAKVEPPDGFAGDMNLTAELRNAESTVLVSSLLRFSWIAVPAPSSMPAVTSLPPAPEPSASQRPREIFRTMPPQEVAMLLRRAQDLLSDGDFQSARLILVRVAEGRDSRAAFALAKTFDPIMLRQFGAQGPLPDLAQARRWYQNAKEWGEPAAQAQLDALATSAR